MAYYSDIIIDIVIYDIWHIMTYYDFFDSFCDIIVWQFHGILWLVMAYYAVTFLMTFYDLLYYILWHILHFFF